MKFQLVDMFPRTQKPVDMFPKPKVRTGRTVDMFLTAIMRTGKENEYLNGSLVPCGDHRIAISPVVLEILEFTYFSHRFTFDRGGDFSQKKRCNTDYTVVVGIDLDTVDM